MSKEEMKRNRIIDSAIKSFMTYGYNRVTMDDIARSIGMGKGTLYKIFPSKEILFLSMVDSFTSGIQKEIEDIVMDEKFSPVDKLNLFLKTVAGKLSTLNPELLLSLERSFPEAYEKIKAARSNIIFKNIVRLLEEGKKVGFYEQEMDERLVAHIMIGAIQQITDTEVYPTLNYSFDHIFHSVTSVIFKGCLTEEGRRVAYPMNR